MVTLALTTTAPDGSVTVPTRVARSRCAKSADAKRMAIEAPRSPVSRRRISPLSRSVAGLLGAMYHWRLTGIKAKTKSKNVTLSKGYGSIRLRQDDPRATVTFDIVQVNHYGAALST